MTQAVEGVLRARLRALSDLRGRELDRVQVREHDRQPARALGRRRADRAGTGRRPGRRREPAVDDLGRRRGQGVRGARDTRRVAAERPDRPCSGACAPLPSPIPTATFGRSRRSSVAEAALRIAGAADEAALAALMTESASALFPRFYDEQRAERGAPRRAGRPPADRRRDVLRARGRPRQSRAAAGAGATGSTRGAAMPRVTRVSSILRSSRRGCARCSSATTGRAAASGDGFSRSARRRRAGGLSHPLADGDAARRAALPCVRLPSPRRGRRTLPDGVARPCVTMEKPIG